MSYKLLIVDDEAPNLRLLERLFREDYYCLTASSGEEAIELLDQHDVAVVITDQRMPQMSGIELLKRSADRRPHMVRILLTGYTDLEALIEAVNCGLVYMYVSKPWNNDDLKLKIKAAVQHYDTNKRQYSLVAANERLDMRIKEMKVGFIRAMAAALRLRDEYSYAHGSRVSKYATALGEALGVSEQLQGELTAAAILHEMGVMGTSDRMLLENSDNANDETLFDQQQERGAQIVSCVTELRDVADIIRYTCENYDGSGQSLGLIGDQIPLTARIIRVASDYDRMVNPRSPRGAVSHEEAVGMLRKGSGSLFDGAVVEALSELPHEDLDNLRELNTVPVRPELITCAIN